MPQNSNFRLPRGHWFFAKNGSYGYGTKSQWGPLGSIFGPMGSQASRLHRHSWVLVLVWRLPFAIPLSFLCLWILYCQSRLVSLRWLLVFSFLLHWCGWRSYLCCLWSLRGTCMLLPLPGFRRSVSVYFFFLFLFLLLCILLLRIVCGTSVLHGWSCQAFLVVFPGHGGLGIHRPSMKKESIFKFSYIFRPSPFFLSSFDISSINAAYSMTDRTPPCLMLSLIFIFLVRP